MKSEEWLNGMAVAIAGFVVFIFSVEFLEFGFDLTGIVSLIIALFFGAIAIISFWFPEKYGNEIFMVVTKFLKNKKAEAK
jgi:FtsH-binding integral membrane protein